MSIVIIVIIVVIDRNVKNEIDVNYKKEFDTIAIPALLNKIENIK